MGIRLVALLAAGGLVLGAVLARADSVSGTWNVAVSGEIDSSCIAEIQRQGKTITGTLVCEQAGLRMPIKATIGSDGKIRPDGGDLGWVVTTSGGTASGTYQGSLGAGSWTAVRQTGD